MTTGPELPTDDSSSFLPAAEFAPSGAEGDDSGESPDLLRGRILHFDRIAFDQTFGLLVADGSHSRGRANAAR